MHIIINYVRTEVHVRCLACYFSSLSHIIFCCCWCPNNCKCSSLRNSCSLCVVTLIYLSFFFQSNEDHCLLLALPCGRDPLDVHKQTRALKSGFINYLQQKQAAGIINVARPGSTQVNVPWENWFNLNYHHEQFGKVMFQVCAFVRVNGLANTWNANLPNLSQW